MTSNSWKLIIILFFTSTLFTQTFSIKPYFGYATVRMDDVNDNMVNQIRQLRRDTGNLMPTPESFGGNYMWGIQAEYRMEGDYFVNLTSYYYREETGVDVSGDAFDMVNFHFNRNIEYFEIGLGVHYFFNYSSWRRINPYLGAGFGLGLGWSESSFQYDDLDHNTLTIDNHGDFSSSALTASFCAGAELRVLPFLNLTGEVGMRFANLQEFNGRLETNSGPPDDDYTTPFPYDFTGFYIMAGTDFIIPIF